MDVAYVDEAIELLEKSNADLAPELMTAAAARQLLSGYARIEKLAAFGVAALTRKISDAAEVARATGTSAGKAEAVVRTGKAMAASAEVECRDADRLGVVGPGDRDRQGRGGEPGRGEGAAAGGA